MQKNLAQEEVIRTIDGQLIVVACPGSGKTTTLVRRIHYMTAECGIDAENILMITFTSAAAKEMKQRYQKTYGADAVTFCTIHSLCLAILRKFRKFSNADIFTDSMSFFYDFLRNNRKINDKEEFVKLLITDISVLKNNSLDMMEFRPQCCDDKKLFEQCYDAYETYKQERGLVDFDDMLIYAYEEMKHNKECLSWLRERYKYIQVDEYQDTNFLQRDIVYLLAGTKGNLAVVGDDDQSIYGFRGARPEVMLDFNEFYPEAKTIRMSTNYRSRKEIVDAADHLIKRNTKRFDKEFESFQSEGGTVGILKQTDRTAQLTEVMIRIKEFIQNGEAPEDIAVLYRTNKQSEALASMLLSEKIPFVSTEKIPNRYKHWIFKDIQSYRKLAEGNYTKQDFSRVLNHPQRFLTDYEYLKIGLDREKMFRYAYRSIREGWKREKALENITEFFYTLDTLRDADPKKFFVVLGRDYIPYIKDYAKFRNEDAQELYDLWNQFKADAETHNDWQEWGRYIVRYTKTLDEAEKNRKGVVLSTMHCAKGLEWKHVFIIDCVEGVTPFRKAETKPELEEERRLFYVAMTRAKEHLTLCLYDKKNGEDTRVSRFLRE